LQKLIAGIVTDSRAPGEPKDTEGSALFQIYQAFASAQETATLAKAYGGTAVVDVAGGQKVNLSMDMGVVETKILLPSAYSSLLYGLDIGDQNPVSIDLAGNVILQNSDFEFDKFGRLYFSANDGSGVGRVFRLDDPSSTPFWIENYTSPGRITIDNVHDRVFLASLSTSYYDLVDGSSVIINLPAGHSSPGDSRIIAVDPAGYIYSNANYNNQDWVFKYSLGPIYGAGAPMSDAQSLVGRTYGELGLSSSILPKDAVVKDGHLYIAAAEHLTPNQRGKILKLSLSDLSMIDEIGWSSGTPSSPSSQFYGPSRFLAITPRKLIVSDEGFDGSNLDRIVEVDLDTGFVSKLQVTTGVVSFFESYFC
ncbi:MAG TPA: hypothetical protein P5117_12975, partial [Spirochaetia bacterium]|nr:hypothetical protein [Spirochaetia bacterium]